MREILFRGKETRNGYWKYGSLMILAGGIDYGTAILDIPDTPEKIACSFQVNPDTVCQHTGMSDKNGTKIYENDIIHVSYEYESPFDDREMYKEEYYGLVAFNEGSFDAVIKGKGKTFLFLVLLEEAEVVGNIFDNPEMWEADND